MWLFKNIVSGSLLGIAMTLEAASARYKFIPVTLASLGYLVCFTQLQSITSYEKEANSK